MDIAEAHGHKKTGTKSELVLEGNAYDQFINAIKTKPTRKLYDIGLKKFMTFKHIDKVSDLLSWDPRIIEANVSAWIVNLKNRNLSSATIKGYLASVLFFYSMNDIEPRRNKIKRYLPEESRVNEDRAYTHQEIAKLIEFCDYRTKTLVLLLASSGMRIGAVPELKIKHLTKIDEYKLYKVKVYARLKKSEHFTYTTPEAASAIDTYIKYRERYGEKISDESPVFREEFNRDDPIVAKSPKKLHPNVLGDQIRVNIYRSGIFEQEPLTEGQKPGQRRYPIPRAHGFRKFFETNLIRAKVQEPIPELLLGHDIGLKKHYLRLTEDEILEEYLKAVDSLTINEENRLKRKVQKLTQETDQIKIMQEQITRLQERHSDLVKSIAGLANSSLPMLHAKSRELFTHEEDLKKWKEENTGRVSLEDMK